MGRASATCIEHLILPALALAAGFSGVIMRTVRSSMLGTLGEEYIVLAHAKGLTERRVLIRHALRNALLPSLTILGMQVGWMLGSTILVESVFSYPGIGNYSVTALFNSDLWAIVGVVVVIGAVFVVANFLTDVIQMLARPGGPGPATGGDGMISAPALLADPDRTGAEPGPPGGHLWFRPRDHPLEVAAGLCAVLHGRGRDHRATGRLRRSVHRQLRGQPHRTERGALVRHRRRRPRRAAAGRLRRADHAVGGGRGAADRGHRRHRDRDRGRHQRPGGG